MENELARKLLKALEAQREVIRRLEASGDAERLAAERQLEADILKRLEATGVASKPSLTPVPLPLIIGSRR